MAVPANTSNVSYSANAECLSDSQQCRAQDWEVRDQIEAAGDDDAQHLSGALSVPAKKQVLATPDVMPEREYASGRDMALPRCWVGLPHWKRRGT